MKQKILLFVLTLGYLFYTYAIITNNNMLGDILSPILLLTISGIVLKGFVVQQKNMKWFGWFITLSIFSWFLCDFWWGIQTLFLHCNPEESFITVYGYFLTNLFLFLAFIYAGYQDLKKMNKVQAMLDTLIVSTCIAILLWLFVFEQTNDKVLHLLSDPISMLSLITDVIIFAWIIICKFSNRNIKPPSYHRLLVTGGLIYVISDFIYFYCYFYSDYEPNSWIDGFYMVAFTLFALSSYSKVKGKSVPVPKKEGKICCKLGVEIFILFVPFVVLIFKRSQIQYVIILVVALLIYYVLINFTQKSIFQGKLIELQQKNVIELERKVDERTKEIIKILNTDFVSGLYSRRYFEAKLSEALKIIDRNEKVAILYIDQNKSRAIKHLYGKEISENLLKKVADTFKQIVSDHNGLIASHGDDIFVVMIKSCDADIVAGRVADQILARCNELFFVDNHAIRVTFNIGISCLPTNTIDAEDLIRNADIAMMQARAKGFNQIQLYNDKIGNLTYNRHRIELKLKKVEFDQEFFLYYQPQVYCNSGKLCGFETLIRWFDAGKNFIPPLDFIPVVEEIGLIVPLGYWIIENAAKQHAAWKAETGNDFRVSVNVSSKQLVEVDFVQRMINILKKYKVSPESFEIEITESQQIENNINILDTLNEIKKYGISIAIDDFGTGYSSLYYLKNIPADRIKIAKELIDNIEKDVYSSLIVQMVISIAKVKGIKVIAEGVETKSQWECLKELECDEIQGYYFAKPMPSDEVRIKWIDGK